MDNIPNNTSKDFMNYAIDFKNKLINSDFFRENKLAFNSMDENGNITIVREKFNYAIPSAFLKNFYNMIIPGVFSREDSLNRAISFTIKSIKEGKWVRLEL